MTKSFHKYSIKFFTLILLSSFILSNVSLCYVLIVNCRSEKATTSCCCKESTENSSQTINKKCCCEVKESPKQPIESPSGLNETFQKSFTFHSKNFSDADFIINKPEFTNFRVISFHSPPKENIYILNSNFRI